MPLTYNAVADAREVLDRADDEPGGIAISFATERDLIAFRHRLNTARKLERDRSERIWPEGDPAHGRSPWDHLSIKREGLSLKITPHKDPLEAAGILGIRPLPPEDPTPDE